MKSRFIVVVFATVISGMTSAANADEFSVRKLIDAQMTAKSMEIGMKASIIDGCLKAGNVKGVCESEADAVDRIDLEGILEKVYGEVYTKEQMIGLYEFYSSPLGKKYSQGMLSLLASQMKYPEKIEMPSLTKKEDTEIKKFQASQLSKMEKSAGPKIGFSINKYVPDALQKARVKK